MMQHSGIVAGISDLAAATARRHPWGLTMTDADRPLAFNRTREHRPQAAERALIAQGWRFLPVPTLRQRPHWCAREVGFPLDWERRTFLAIPPDGMGAPAQSFRRKSDALAYAARLSPVKHAS